MEHIHRDIKPENILLAPCNDSDVSLDQDELKIVDFGFAAQYSLESVEHMHNERIGTILFMAPEQIDKRTYGRVRDFSSINLIGFRKLTYMRVASQRITFSQASILFMNSDSLLKSSKIEC